LLGEKRRQLENSLQTDWARREMTRIQKWLKDVYSGSNPIGACDHYNNPNKEARPGWMDRVDFVITIGNHHFYRTKPEYR
jgi:spore germination cell wall hydrolase CwlJ-like protein